MLNNLLFNAFSYWFDQDTKIEWIKDEWTKPLWIALVCIAALFLLIIIFMFFKAIRRTRERRVAREVARERAVLTREQKHAEKEAEKVRKQAEKEARKAQKEAAREDKRREKEKNRLEDSAATDQVSSEQSIAAMLALDREEHPREMISLTVNTDFVRRDFYVGDELTYDGLIVNAHFNREPFKEQVSGFSVVAPDMSKIGSPTVVVMYQDRATSYVVHVRENPDKREEQPVQPQYQPQPQVQTIVQPVAPAQEFVYVEQPRYAGERVLEGITLDLGIVQRVFEKGEEFNCEGLVVYAQYNRKPTVESFVDYTLIDEHAFRRLERLDRVRGVYVIKPHLHTVGIKTVTVGYKDVSIAYTISVMPQQKKVKEKEQEPIRVEFVPIMQAAPQPVAQPVEQPVAQPAPQPEQKVEAPVEEQPKPVRELTNLTLDTAVVQRDFEVGEEFNCDGLLVNASFSLAPMQETYADFSVVDSKTFDQVMKSDAAGVYVCEPDLSTSGKKAVRVCVNKCIALYVVFVRDKKVQAPAKEEQPEPVVVERVVEKIVEVPVEKVVEKVVEVPVEQPVQESVVVETKQVVETVVIGEETYEAGRLRYDKSFEAKFIQSDDDVKHWYTEIKNELLSYKGCKGRISWKRETFKAKKEVVAKLVFRGNTLCLFVPLNVADYADNKEIEDASNLPVYEETPVMIRIKNEKRKRMALDLIAKVMTERGVLHGMRKTEDFYVPYEGVLELINRGLIKREIKSVEDEAIFDRDNKDEE